MQNKNKKNNEKNCGGGWESQPQAVGRKDKKGGIPRMRHPRLPTRLDAGTNGVGIPRMEDLCPLPILVQSAFGNDRGSLRGWTQGQTGLVFRGWGIRGSLRGWMQGQKGVGIPRMGASAAPYCRGSLLPRLPTVVAPYCGWLCMR